MPMKEMEFDGNNVVQSEDHSLRISMENLRLRDNCQREEHIRESDPVSLRGQNSQLVDEQLNLATGFLKQLEVCAINVRER